MHIAYLTTEYPYNKLTQNGGIGSSIHNLANGLVKNGYQATVFILNQNEDFEVDVEGIRLISLKHKYPKLPGIINRRVINKRINTYIKTLGIDLIEIPDWSGLSAFMSFGIPSVVRLHGTDTYFCHMENRKVKAKNKFLEWITLKHADAVISVSEFTALKTKELFKLRRRIKVIPNGLDLSLFEPESTVAKNKRLLYLGTLARKKGVLELAHIFNEVHKLDDEIELWLIGRDNIDKAMNASTYELFKNLLNEGAQVKHWYQGEVSYDKVVDYFNQSSVVVFPSLAEAFPMSWLEAMALEKPIVASNIGWAKEIMVHNKTGFLGDPKDHKQFAQRIVEMVSNPEKAQRFGKNARSHLKGNFSIDMILKQNIKFYNALLK